MHTYPCGRTWCDCTFEGTACAKVLDPVRPTSPYGKPSDNLQHGKPRCHIIPGMNADHAVALCGKHTSTGLENPEGIWVDGRCTSCGNKICFECEAAWYCK